MKGNLLDHKYLNYIDKNCLWGFFRACHSGRVLKEKNKILHCGVNLKKTSFSIDLNLPYYRKRQSYIIENKICVGITKFEDKTLNHKVSLDGKFNKFYGCLWIFIEFLDTKNKNRNTFIAKSSED